MYAKYAPVRGIFLSLFFIQILRFYKMLFRALHQFIAFSHSLIYHITHGVGFEADTFYIFKDLG